MFFVTDKRVVLLIVLIGAFVSGCRANRKPIHNLSAHNAPPSYRLFDNTYWWGCKFKVVWPDNAEADWAIDLLLAHAIVAPILVEQINDIPYWRFHRRTSRDHAGHQFSLLFYSKPEIASAVFSDINQNQILKRAIKANLLEKVTMDDINYPYMSYVEDASDQHWSSDLQKNWPSFIMGASSMWLGLIEDSMQDTPHDFEDINSLLEKYREVNNQITDIWKTEGQHALLHHLNAIFGYQPMRINKELSF